jgi:hypothetical protein
LYIGKIPRWNKVFPHSRCRNIAENDSSILHIIDEKESTMGRNPKRISGKTAADSAG